MAPDDSVGWPAHQLPDTPLRALQRDYRFCTRCWLPLAPVRRCRCELEPYPDDATPARVVSEYPALRTLATAVERGAYPDDTATWEQRALGFWRWLYKHRRVGEHAVWTYEVIGDADATA